MSKNQNTNHGKPWKTAASFDCYEDADSKRNNLQKNANNLQTKVRLRRSQQTYSVLYRELVDNSPKEKKNSSGKKKARKK